MNASFTPKPWPERIMRDARAPRVEALFQDLPEAAPYGMPWPAWNVTPPLLRMLHLVRGSQELVLGLETLAETFSKRWPGGTQGPKAQLPAAQFLLLATTDGSPRFGKQLAAFWEEWGPLGRAAFLATTGTALGQALFKKDKEVRALAVVGEAGLIKFLLGVVS